MNSRTRILLAAASLLLLVTYAAPLWRITLEAPQYPEGLGLRIHLTDIDGLKPHDLQNINNLNHYIGMKRIEPDSIPELRIMPWAIGALIVFGLLAAATGRRWMLYAWTGAFAVLILVGIVDFYLWAYDYGHNLDFENAAIKVPGMTYQPPIFGSKKLLNFTAHSWPDTGGWAAFLSLLTGVVLSFRSIRIRRETTRNKAAAASSVPTGALVVSVLIAGLLGGCTPEPEPFVFGSDQDAFCRMTIADPAFAAQIVSTTGRTYKFDSIECMRGFLEADSIPEDEIHSLWVTDAASGALVRVDDALFVRGSAVQSPMGGGLIAFKEATDAELLAAEKQGVVLDWKRLAGTAQPATMHEHPGHRP